MISHRHNRPLRGDSSTAQQPTIRFEDNSIYFRGDADSIHVVYRNLTGENFANAPAWRVQSHSQYLDYMEREYGPIIGRKLGLFDQNGALLHCAVITPRATHTGQTE